MSKWTEKKKSNNNILDGVIFIPSKPFTFEDEYDYLLDWEPIYDKKGLCVNIPLKVDDEEANNIINKFTSFWKWKDEGSSESDEMLLNKALVDYYTIRKNNVTFYRETAYKRFIEDEKMKQEIASFKKKQRESSRRMYAANAESKAAQAESTKKLADMISRNKKRAKFIKEAKAFSKRVKLQEEMKLKKEKEQKEREAFAKEVADAVMKLREDAIKKKNDEDAKVFRAKVKLANDKIPPHRCKVENLDFVTNMVVFDLYSSVLGKSKTDAIMKEVIEKKGNDIPPDSYKGNSSLYLNHAVARGINKYADSLQSPNWRSVWERRKKAK